MSVLPKELEEAMSYHERYHNLGSDTMTSVRSTLSSFAKIHPSKTKLKYVLHPISQEEGFSVIASNLDAQASYIEVSYYRDKSMTVECSELTNDIAALLSLAAETFMPKSEESKDSTPEALKETNDSGDDEPLTVGKMKKMLRELMQV